MSHEAHSHDTHSTEKKHKAPLSAAFWFVLVLVCLFIAALNFVNVMGGEEGEGHGGHGTHAEATHGIISPEHEGGAAEAHEHAAPAAEHATTADTAAAAHSEEAHH